MKTVNVRNLQRKVSECVALAQKEDVVVIRRGQPAAIVVGVEGHDWEDILYRISPGFWKMIEERRKGKTIPIEAMRRRLEKHWARRKARR